MSTRSTRHRSQRGQATPSVVVVISAVVLVAALVALVAGGVGEEPVTQARAQTKVAVSTAAPPSPSETPETSETPKARDADEHRDQKKHSRPRQRTPNNRPQQTGVPDVYIEVYNNSTISGLAASTAAQLQDGGWQVVGVDNWHGNIPASTVYYPDGLSAEAHQLAQTLGIERVWGAVTPMKFDRLTVILTPDAA